MSRGPKFWIIGLSLLDKPHMDLFLALATIKVKEHKSIGILIQKGHKSMGSKGTSFCWSFLREI